MKNIVRSIALANAVAFGLIAPDAAKAANFCIAVNGGVGHGGTSYVGPSFALPAAGKCAAWAGFTKTAVTVIAIGSGTGCVSSVETLFTP